MTCFGSCGRSSGTDLRDFLLPRLFTPLRINNPRWLRCPLGAVGLQLRTAEIGRIAQVLPNGATPAGRRLITADYLEQMITDTTPTGRAEPDNQFYGLHVWRCWRDAAFRMDGIYGQFGIVAPRHAATISVSAHYLGPTTDILDAVWEFVVPAL